MVGKVKTNRPGNVVKCPFSLIECPINKKINEDKMKLERMPAAPARENIIKTLFLVVYNDPIAKINITVFSGNPV